MAFLEIVDVSVAYQNNVVVLKNLSLSVEKGSFLSLLGPSGCGKTTTLRTLAGFISPMNGKIIVNGKDYTRVPPHKRNMGIVFQSYALFPHLNVFENIAFGLKMRKLNKSEIDQRVKRAIDLVGLSGLEYRLPSQLSGGQQQRVGIARAIVIEPDVLLMDEPLSNLDANLRIEMRNEIRRIQQKLGITTIYVTHDQSEAVALSDQIAVMNNGKIVQLDTPKEVFSNPKTRFVANFMGFQEIAKGVVEKVEGDFATIKTVEKSLKARTTTSMKENEKVVLCARARRMMVDVHDGENKLSSLVASKIFQGESVSLILKMSDGNLVGVETELSQLENITEGDRVFLHIPAEHLLAIKEEEE
ncbi:ABC transporter ATP-binding protein [Thermotoga profunda]|uniref:ABC transporter ATP-binding protein n=1 Tax=Thermotoga profunda TaxID=1508420 RepID=UPI0005977426|nr:ABC transporter ATP-binding protein [Thermotoga profunda]